MAVNDEQLFTQLIYVFYTAAMQGMGKLVNPISNKIEKNLEQAKESIDMLEMICTKTKNNLGSDSEKLLTQFLTDLRLNYIEEVNKKD